MRFIKELNDAILNEDFYETHQILEMIKQEEDAFEYLLPIFDIMEKNPELDYGMPGPIVHFMEGYYRKGYEELLLDSIRKFPTGHTVWMLNRVMNDAQLNNRDKYIEVLKSSLNRNDISQIVRNDIEKLCEVPNGMNITDNLEKN